MTVPIPTPVRRLAYIDWMRGLACVLMIQAHCYDSWLSPEARKTALYRWSQEVSTLAAPIFLFLCGVSFALVSEGLRQKKAPSAEIVKTASLRGAEIFGFGFLLRLQEFVLGYPMSPWTDLLRVDVLNILGVSILLMAVFWWLTASPRVTEALRADNAWLLQNWRARAIVLSLAHCGNHCRGYASVVDDSPASFSALAAGVVHQWRAHFRCSSTVAVFDFSVVRICVCGLAFGLFLFSDFAQRREVDSARHCRRNWSGGLRGISVVGQFVREDLCRLRLLAQQPEFFPDALRNSADAGVRDFCVVPLGTGHEGIQPLHPDGANFAAGLLGAHRVRLRAAVDFAQGAKQHPLSTVGMLVIFAAMLGLSIWRTNAKKRAAMRLNAAQRRRVPRRQCNCILWNARSYGLVASACGSNCDCGILMMISPGLARISSSRAIFSIARGSLFKSFTTCSSAAFSLFNCLNFGSDFLDVVLRAAHGQKSVRAENVVDHKHRYEQRQQRRSVFLCHLSQIFHQFPSAIPVTPTSSLRSSTSRKPSELSAST